MGSRLDHGFVGPCSPICPPEEWLPLFVPWVTMGGPTHLWLGPPISSTHQNPIYRESQKLLSVAENLATGKYGCTEVRVYPAECGEQLRTDPSKIGSSKSLVLKSFSGEGTLWDSSLPVSLTLWDTPAFFTPPLPLPHKTRDTTLVFSGASGLTLSLAKHTQTACRCHV